VFTDLKEALVPVAGANGGPRIGHVMRLLDDGRHQVLPGSLTVSLSVKQALSLPIEALYPQVAEPRTGGYPDVDGNKR
jgi:hypothetical protein